MLSTGTWIIGFDTDAGLENLDKERDTVSNTDVLGRLVASCRFFGGKEFEIVSGDAPAEAASLADGRTTDRARHDARLPPSPIQAGPLPGTGGKGRIVGPPAETTQERSSLAALYCALMCDQSLNADRLQGAAHRRRAVCGKSGFPSVLAALRPGQPVFASDLRDGTAAGAAVLALMEGTGRLPHIALSLRPVVPAMLAGLDLYRQRWLNSSTVQA